MVHFKSCLKSFRSHRGKGANQFRVSFGDCFTSRDSGVSIEVDVLTQQQEPIQHDAEPASEATIVAQYDEPNGAFESPQLPKQDKIVPRANTASATSSRQRTAVPQLGWGEMRRARTSPPRS